MKKERLGELIANTISHGIGVVFGIVFLVILLLNASETRSTIGALVFGIAMIILYLASTLFHAFPETFPGVRKVFQRLDHSAIYVLIAGTYTPFVLMLAPTQKGYTLLIVLWLITFIGITLKAIWIKKFKAVHIIMYLLMGWSVLTIWSDVSPVISGNAMTFLFLGGISYTVGVLFYISRFNYAHFVWHIFVLGGSTLHFVSIYTLVS